MKTLIVYTSKHRGNTEKIAKAITQALNADLLKTEDARPETLENYDLIGFGSGWYGGAPDRDLINLIKSS